MSALKIISKNVFDSSINLKNMMSIFSFNLFIHANTIWFFKRFDLLNIKKNNKKRKFSFCIKKKLKKLRCMNWEFSNENKYFENDNWRIFIIAAKKNQHFHFFRIKYDHWLISKFSSIFQNFWIISKRMKKMLVSDNMQKKEKKLLLICFYNRKIVFVWNFFEIN